MISKVKTTGKTIISMIIVTVLFLNTIFVKAQDKKSIKMAILLDTSNSMDGLIDQAKSQLWTIVNEMAKAKCDNTKADLKIALYEYGNSSLPLSEGYIRMVTPLTNDLDQLSEDLFSLKTNGGQEYCGQVIQTALRELDWEKGGEDYQVIFIAGNEPFTQGSVHYKDICTEAKERGIVVNTIFCGDFNEGIRGQWKYGALLTGGDYFSIEQDKKTVYINTPYDDKIVNLNHLLNTTYIYYGDKGYEKKEMQVRQDDNAGSYGAANTVKRAVSKSSHVYNNKSWDLVDAAEEPEFEITSVAEEYLPKEMKGMSEKEKIKYVNSKKEEREVIKKEINELNKKREAYIKNQAVGQNENMLDEAIVKSVSKQAAVKNFVFE